MSVAINLAEYQRIPCLRCRFMLDRSGKKSLVPSPFPLAHKGNGSFGDFANEMQFTEVTPIVSVCKFVNLGTFTCITPSLPPPGHYHGPVNKHKYSKAQAR